MYTTSCQQFASGTVAERVWREWMLPPNEFWKNIQLSFQASLERLNHMLAEKGINLAASAPDIWEEQEGEITAKHTKAWPYIGWAKLYGEQVQLWEDNYSQNTDYQEITPVDRDLHAVIRQYQHYIFAKLNRVAQFHEYYASLERDPESEAEILVETQKASLAIERSLGAWNFLLELHSKDSEAISDLMVLLLRIRFHLSTTFPEIEHEEFPTFCE